MVDEGWDKLIDDAASTYDTEMRKGFYKQLAEKMFDEAWNGYLWVQAYNWAHTTQVKNFKEPSAIVDMSEVWLEE
jgi:ABC-type transport system substrate-binding protein